jgi:mannosyl-3-phosphoglycerate synthase
VGSFDTLLLFFAMLAKVPTSSTCIGEIEFRETTQVFALDPITFRGSINGYESFSSESLSKIEKQMAIIVPCMNEEYPINAVLRGIPQKCLIVVVSNSIPDKYTEECAALEYFCSQGERPGIIAHQQDEGIAHAFSAAGTNDIIDESSSRVRNGEAMMIGVVLAKLADKQFVGFVDADNFVPGSVLEYCKAYAAGFFSALGDESDVVPSTQKADIMVRIVWKSKPKAVDSKIVLVETGRCSRIVNERMNDLWRSIGDGTLHDTIRTSNAGEHAMNIDLALNLPFATGYAVEPFQLVALLELYGGKLQPTENPSSVIPKVQVLQIETCNPHFHNTSKADEHVQKMVVQGLGTIHNSPLAEVGLKEDILDDCSNHCPGLVECDGLPKAHIYKPMRRLNFETFKKTIEDESSVKHFSRVSQ